MSRGVYCNRTLNLRAIRAIGYDLDYTLVHYHTARWERRAWEHVRTSLAARALPVDDLAFDPTLVSQGLILDTQLGNIVKANRFGYVKRASHGTAMLSWGDVKQAYARTFVDLREPRWQFLNTLFAVSEAMLYLQLVDKLDQGALRGTHGYPDLLGLVRGAVDEAHTTGVLKEEIAADPATFVALDPDMPLALLDQKRAGKALLLITNSEYAYGTAMLRYAVDPYLPGEMSWKGLFDVAFFAARKPRFFTDEMPVFEVVDDDGLLRPHVGPVHKGGVYVGGHAELVERSLALQGEEILYVGDHLFADVNVTKSLLRWRTALVLRALEDEIEAIGAFAPRQAALNELMAEKELLEEERRALRLARQRVDEGYGPQPRWSSDDLDQLLARVRQRIEVLDQQISPLAAEAGALVDPRWGPLMRTGADKSHLARQVERYADVYTSRVSNFGALTPHAYLRSPKGSLPHDP